MLSQIVRKNLSKINDLDTKANKYSNVFKTYVKEEVSQNIDKLFSYTAKKAEIMQKETENEEQDSCDIITEEKPETFSSFIGDEEPIIENKSDYIIEDPQEYVLDFSAIYSKDNEGEKLPFFRSLYMKLDLGAAA